jgi:hypothetical protein
MIEVLSQPPSESSLKGLSDFVQVINFWLDSEIKALSFL